MRNRAAFIILFLTLHISSVNAAIIRPTLNANDIYLTVGKKGEQISLMEFFRIKAEDLELLTGRKMRFMKRISFKIPQKKMSKASLPSEGKPPQTPPKEGLEKPYSSENHYILV